MSIEKVKEYFKNCRYESPIIEFSEDTATVSLAAAAIGCTEAMIAKTLSFDTQNGVVLIVMSGQGKVDNRKFKDEFSEKAKMVPFSEVEEKTGHAPGGVCPFAVKDGIKVYADISLKKFEYFYPAAGNANSAVKMTADELVRLGNVIKWVDVCKDM